MVWIEVRQKAAFCERGQGEQKDNNKTKILSQCRIGHTKRSQTLHLKLNTQLYFQSKLEETVEHVILQYIANTSTERQTVQGEIRKVDINVKFKIIISTRENRHS